MNSDINRILMIIMKDGERLAYSVPGDREPKEMYEEIKQSPEFDNDQIKTSYYFPHTVYNVNDYLEYFDEESKTVDDLPLSIDFKLREFHKQRSHFFNVLDLEFMKSLEEGDEAYKAHIVLIKNYLRDAPPQIENYCKKLPIKEVVEFNAFNNIFDIDIIHSGNGYSMPPKVTIDPPEMSGFQAEAVAMIKDGKVSNITMTRVGSGYIDTPRVVLSSPDGDGELAIASARTPENDIHTVQKMLQKKDK